MGATPLRGWQFQEQAEDWRVLSTSGAVAWFAASSHSEGAALVRRIVDLVSAGTAPEAHRPNLDLRVGGVQVRIPDDAGLTTDHVTLAQGISGAAQDLGLLSDPSVPQDMEWGIDTLDKRTLLPFWETILGYEDTEDDDLLDPLRRDPRVWFYQAAPRPLRDRIHFDVAVARDEALRRAAAVAGLGVRDEYAPDEWKVLLADAEGNEVDLVPADGPDTGAETADWLLPFGGMVFYPTGDLGQAAQLAEGVACVADEVGLPLMIDIRAAGVTIDTGKDQWEDSRFTETARRAQAAARDLGLVADPSRLRFVQVCIDAVDIPPVREFWRAALGYENDQREFVTDIYDPRRLNRPMIFQQMDPDDTARREQRNRTHLDLYLPHDQVEARIEAALAAGGRFTREAGGTIADPEGNEVDITKALADPTQ